MVKKAFLSVLIVLVIGLFVGVCAFADSAVAEYIPVSPNGAETSFNTNNCKLFTSLSAAKAAILADDTKVCKTIELALSGTDATSVAKADTVVLAEGTYLVADLSIAGTWPLIIDETYVKVIAGWDKVDTLINGTGANTEVIRITGHDVTLGGSGFEIRQTGAGWDHGAIHAGGGVNDVLIKDLKIESDGSCISFLGAHQDWTIEDNELYTSGYFGITSQDPGSMGTGLNEGIVIKNNEFHALSAGVAWQNAIRVVNFQHHGATKSQIIDNDLTDFNGLTSKVDEMICVEGDAADLEVEIKNNTLDMTGVSAVGIVLRQGHNAGGTAVTYKDVTISGNTITDVAINVTGILVEARIADYTTTGQTLTVGPNNITGASGTGIKAQTGTIKDNILTDLKTGIDVTQDHANSTEDVILDNNTITSSKTAPMTGIKLNKSNAGAKLTVKNNTISQSLTGTPPAPVAASIGVDVDNAGTASVVGPGNTVSQMATGVDLDDLDVSVTGNNGGFNDNTIGIDVSVVTTIFNNTFSGNTTAIKDISAGGSGPTIKENTISGGSGTGVEITNDGAQVLSNTFSNLDTGVYVHTASPVNTKINYNYFQTDVSVGASYAFTGGWVDLDVKGNRWGDAIPGGNGCNDLAAGTYPGTGVPANSTPSAHLLCAGCQTKNAPTVTEKDTPVLWKSGTFDFYAANKTPNPGPDATVDFGNSDDIPLLGDWDGSGTDTIGVYRPSSARFFLSDSNTNPVQSIALFFGNHGDTPLTGDWAGSGSDHIGVYRSGRFYLDEDNNGVADTTRAFGNSTGDIPVVGNFDGDVADEIGVYRVAEGRFYLWTDFPSTPATVVAYSYGSLGETGQPLTADFSGMDATTKDGLALYRTNGNFHLDADWDGTQDISTFTIGDGTATALFGNWDGKALLSPGEPQAVVETAVGLQVTELKVFPTIADNVVHFAVQGTGIAGMEVAVYDLAGMNVFTASANDNAVSWNLVTNDGFTVANGVYLCSITVKGYDGNVICSEVRKLIVLK